MMHKDDTTSTRAPKNVSPKVAKQFAGGRELSTFRSAGTGYEMETIFSCRRCAERGHPGLSPREFQFLEVGYTGEGLQVWCKRCEKEVWNLDFGGHALKKCGPNRATLGHSDGPALDFGACAGCGDPRCGGQG